MRRRLAGKTSLRLDFNENAVGCSPKVASFLHAQITRECLAIYPEYVEAKARLAAHFGVAESEMLLTNGTDEAIQVLIKTFVEREAEIIILQPSYAMYRFYAELGGATIRSVSYRQGLARVPAGGVACYDHAGDTRDPYLESQQTQPARR